jgi:hypothetical protein
MTNDKYNQDKTNNNNTNNNEPISFIDPLSYYDSLFAISDSEFKKRLRSKDSLRHFKDYVESIANLESSVRQISFLPSFFSFMDNFIDNYHQVFLNELVSINETPHKAAKQVDATGLLRYYSPHPHPHPQGICSSLPSERHAATTNTADADAPLLMVYAPINRYHILDLNPERSVVKKFVSTRFDVFLLDWGGQTKQKQTHFGGLCRLHRPIGGTNKKNNKPGKGEPVRIQMGWNPFHHICCNSQQQNKKHGSSVGKPRF